MKIDNEFLDSIKKKVKELESKFNTYCTIEFIISVQSHSLHKPEIKFWYYVSTRNKFSTHLSSIKLLEAHHSYVMEAE